MFRTNHRRWFPRLKRTWGAWNMTDLEAADVQSALYNYRFGMATSDMELAKRVEQCANLLRDGWRGDVYFSLEHHEGDIKERVLDRWDSREAHS